MDGNGAAAIVVHVALGELVELLGTVKARNVAPTVWVVQLSGSKVDCLLVVLLLAINDFDLWNMGRSGIFTMLAQLSPLMWESPSKEASPL
jgi:hypothetical protein